MKISMQAADLTLQQHRAEIAQLTAEFESKNGPVQTTDIIWRGATPPNWNGALVTDGTAKRGAENSAINQQVLQQYATAPCLTELAKALGISVSSLGKRAGRLGISRDKATKINNHANNKRSAKRLTKTAELLEAGQPVETIAEKLDISPRLVRHYRQQLESMQEAA